MAYSRADVAACHALPETRVSGVYSILESLARFKTGNVRRLNLDGRTCLRITTLTCCAVLNRKRTKTNQRYLVTFLERIGYCFYYCVQRAAGISFG